MNKLLLLTGCLLMARPVAAQITLRSVQEALALARRQNPELQIARQNRTAQALQQAASRAAFRPTVRAFSNLDYNYALPTQLIPAEFLGGQPGEFRTIQFGVPYNLVAGVEVTAPLLNGPARVDAALAAQNLQILDHQNLVLQDEISTQVARLYHAALLTRAAIDMARRNLATADTIVTIARQRLDKGLIEPLEANRLLAIRLTNEDVLRQNETSFKRNVAQLKLALGLARRDSLVLQEDLEDLTTPVVATGPAPGERPQVGLRRAQLEFYRLQLDRERALRLPALSAYGRYSEQAQRRQFTFFDVNQRWFPIGLIGLQFNMPIYTGGLRTANLTRARLRIQQAEAELAYEEARAGIDTDDIRDAYRQSLRSLDLNRQHVDVSEQNTRIALIKYRAGIFAYDQYLNVFNEALNAQNRYLNTLSNVFINQTILQIRNGQ